VISKSQQMLIFWNGSSIIYHCLKSTYLKRFDIMSIKAFNRGIIENFILVILTKYTILHSFSPSRRHSSFLSFPLISVLGGGAGVSGDPQLIAGTLLSRPVWNHYHKKCFSNKLYRYWNISIWEALMHFSTNEDGGENRGWKKLKKASCLASSFILFWSI
jgi:hypothetical protein